MAQPARVIWRRPHRTQYEGKAKGAKKVDFGEYGLMVIEGKGLDCQRSHKTGAWITEKQIEAARVVVSKTVALYIKQGAKMWIRIFPQLSISKRAIGARQGGGKGAPECFKAVAKKGQVIIEIAGVPEAEARRALEKAGNKLNVKCKVIARNERGLYE